MARRVASASRGSSFLVSGFGLFAGFPVDPAGFPASLWEFTAAVTARVRHCALLLFVPRSVLSTALPPALAVIRPAPWFILLRADSRFTSEIGHVVPPVKVILKNNAAVWNCSSSKVAQTSFFCYHLGHCALSSVGLEHSTDTRKVLGSNPRARTEV